MNLTFKFFIIILICLTVNCFSKTHNINGIDTTKIHRINNFDHLLKGSPYFMNSWFSNAVMYLNSSKIEADLVFNIYTNKLLFSKGNFQEAILIRPDSFDLAGFVFVKLDSQIKPKNNNYFQKIYSNGKLQLLKQYICEFYEKNESRKLGYENAKDPYVGYYLKKASFFIIIDNQKIEIDNRFLRKKGPYNSKIESFVIQNNLNLEVENDVIRLAMFFNSII